MAPDALVDFHTGAYLGGYDNTTQSATHARALELAHAESSSREDQPEGAGDQPEGAGDQPSAGDAAARSSTSSSCGSTWRSRSRSTACSRRAAP